MSSCTSHSIVVGRMCLPHRRTRNGRYSPETKSRASRAHGPGQARAHCIQKSLPSLAGLGTHCRNQPLLPAPATQEYEDRHPFSFPLLPGSVPTSESPKRRRYAESETSQTVSLSSSGFLGGSKGKGGGGGWCFLDCGYTYIGQTKRSCSDHSRRWGTYLGTYGTRLLTYTGSE